MVLAGDLTVMGIPCDRLRCRQMVLLVTWPVLFGVKYALSASRFIQAMWFISMEWHSERYMPTRYREGRWLTKVVGFLGANDQFDAYIAVACTLGAARHRHNPAIRDRYHDTRNNLDTRLATVGAAWAYLLVGLHKGSLSDDGYVTLQTSLAGTISPHRASRWLNRIARQPVESPAHHVSSPTHEGRDSGPESGREVNG